MTLDEVLEQAHLSDQQLNSQTIKEIRRVLRDQDISVAGECDRALKEALDAYKQLTGLCQTSVRNYNALEAMVRSAREFVITDDDTLNGLHAYEQMLSATVMTFGLDHMTEAVMCKAIEAASYGMWRNARKGA